MPSSVSICLLVIGIILGGWVGVLVAGVALLLETVLLIRAGIIPE